MFSEHVSPGRRNVSPLSPTKSSTTPASAKAGQPNAMLAAGVILVRQPEDSAEMEVLIGRYEVVNALRVTQTHVAIEYFQRRVRSGERERWAAPRARTVAAIERTVAIARGECS